jgi:hypothetical protein
MSICGHAQESAILSDRDVAAAVVKNRMQMVEDAALIDIGACLQKYLKRITNVDYEITVRPANVSRICTIFLSKESIMKLPLLIVCAIVMAFSLFLPAVQAQTAAPPASSVAAAVQSGAQLAPVVVALSNNGSVPTAVTQVAGAINAAAPSIASTVAGIQAAGNDPAAVVAATANGIAQATAQASTVPSPITGYLLLASIIAGFVQAMATLFVHKSTVAALANSTPIAKSAT